MSLKLNWLEFDQLRITAYAINGWSRGWSSCKSNIFTSFQKSLFWKSFAHRYPFMLNARNPEITESKSGVQCKWKVQWKHAMEMERNELEVIDPYGLPYMWNPSFLTCNLQGADRCLRCPAIGNRAWIWSLPSSSHPQCMDICGWTSEILDNRQ